MKRLYDGFDDNKDAGRTESMAIRKVLQGKKINKTEDIVLRETHCFDVEKCKKYENEWGYIKTLLKTTNTKIKKS